MSVHLYVEGGGNHNKSLASQCRQAFAEFFKRAGLQRGSISTIPCGGRKRTYDDFCIALTSAGEHCPMLLVDSEAPVVSFADPWKHVADRKGDRWARPAGATNDQIHFMAQAMESWFYADKELLREYYGQHFREAALSTRPNVEDIPKAELYGGLKRATRDCQKGEYSKGKHSFEILGAIDPVKVRAASPHAERLLAALVSVE